MTAMSSMDFDAICNAPGLAQANQLHKETQRAIEKMIKSQKAEERRREDIAMGSSSDEVDVTEFLEEEQLVKTEDSIKQDQQPNCYGQGIFVHTSVVDCFTPARAVVVLGGCLGHLTEEQSFTAMRTMLNQRSFLACLDASREKLEALWSIMCTSGTSDAQAAFEELASYFAGLTETGSGAAWMPSIPDFWISLQASGYRPPVASTSEMAAGSEGPIRGSSAQVHHLHLVIQLLQEICRLPHAGVSKPDFANQATDAKHLVVALHHMRLDPVLQSALLTDLSRSAELLVEAWATQDEPSWRRAETGIAETLAGLGPTHRASIKALASLPGCGKHIIGLSQTSALALLRRLLQVAHDRQAGSSSRPRGHAHELRRVMGEPKSIAQKAVGYKLEGRAGVDYWMVKTIVQAGDAVMWPLQVAGELAEQDSSWWVNTLKAIEGELGTGFLAAPVRKVVCAIKNNHEAGTRSGLHGQTLVSMGLVDLDRLLGGGLPLGSLLLVVEDAHSRQHLNFMKYFMAEGVTIGQRVAWLTAQPPRGGPGQFLPAEASSASASRSTKESGEEAEEAQAELRIAWQYRKYIQQQQQEAAASSSSGSSRSGGSTAGGAAAARKKAGGSVSGAVEAGIGREWCRSYDLSKSMGQEATTKSGLTCLDCGATDYATGRSSSNIDVALNKARSFVTSLLPAPGRLDAAGALPVPSAASRGPDSVGRLVVQSVGNPAWWGQQQQQQGASSAVGSGLGGAVSAASAAGGASGGEDVQQVDQERQLVCFLQQLRHMLVDTRCAAMVTCPAGLFSPSALMRLKHAADAVLTLQTLSDDSEVYALLPDATSACALLSINKLPSAGLLAPRLPETTLYVIRHKRRRLAISVVDVDPDAEAKQLQQQQQIRPAAAASDGPNGPAQRGPPSRPSAPSKGGSLEF